MGQVSDFIPSEVLLEMQRECREREIIAVSDPPHTHSSSSALWEDLVIQNKLIGPGLCETVIDHVRGGGSIDFPQSNWVEKLEFIPG